MIICECCTNWTDLSMARDMIKEAKENEADLAKFQLYDAEDDKGKPHYDWVKAHQLTFNQAKMLFDYGASIGIEVFFSVFGIKFVNWCEKIGVKRYKLASGMHVNRILFDAVIGTQKKLYISIKNADEDWRVSPRDFMIDLLFCPGNYPQNLSQTVIAYRETFRGLSDHTIGLDAAKIALARGAQIIEKHFCLEHNPDFPDNDWSMTPDELKELARWEEVCKQVLN